MFWKYNFLLDYEHKDKKYKHYWISEFYEFEFTENPFISMGLPY